MGSRWWCVHEIESYKAYPKLEQKRNPTLGP